MNTVLWVVHCFDHPDASERRRTSRPAHSARLRSDRLRPVLYGPLVADDGQTAIGSLILVHAQDRAEVEQFINEDPFVTEKVWQEIRINAFLQSERSPYQVPRA
jgi:uncharacterized protein YciI